MYICEGGSVFLMHRPRDKGDQFPKCVPPDGGGDGGLVGGNTGRDGAGDGNWHDAGILVPSPRRWNFLFLVVIGRMPQVTGIHSRIQFICRNEGQHAQIIQVQTVPRFHKVQPKMNTTAHCSCKYVNTQTL